MSDHYKNHPSGIEAIEITQYESFLRGNILKYVLRAPYKGSEYEDLLKAAEYLQWEIERVEEERFWARFDDTVVKERLEEVEQMRNEWDSDENIGYVADNWQVIYKKRAAEVNDQYDYYRAGMTKTFDEVAFPDKCQECEGDCKVC